MAGTILSRTWQVLLVSKKKISGNHAFLSFNLKKKKKNATYIALYFTVFCRIIIVVSLSLKNAWFPPIFSLDFNSPC